jgi:type IV secretory pathway TrbL component
MGKLNPGLLAYMKKKAAMKSKGGKSRKKRPPGVTGYIDDKPRSKPKKPRKKRKGSKPKHHDPDTRTQSSARGAPKSKRAGRRIKKGTASRSGSYAAPGQASKASETNPDVTRTERGTKTKGGYLF